MQDAILLTEEYWANTQLSIVRRIGSITINENTFTIVNKEGIDVFTLSQQAKGDDEIIPSGEPCDLVRCDFIPLYRQLGREKFIEMLKTAPPNTEPKKVMRYMKIQIKKLKTNK